MMSPNSPMGDSFQWPITKRFPSENPIELINPFI